MAFLSTNNGIYKMEIKKAIPFAMTQRIKHLGVNLTNHGKNLYNENHKTFLKINWRGHKSGKYIHGLKESTLLKSPSYFKWFSDLVQSYQDTNGILELEKF